MILSYFHEYPTTVFLNLHQPKKEYYNKSHHHQTKDKIVQVQVLMFIIHLILVFFIAALEPLYISMYVGPSVIWLPTSFKVSKSEKKRKSERKQKK